MDVYSATEQAYKNGYERGIKDLADNLKKQKEKPEFPRQDFYVTESVIDQTADSLIKKGGR